jgi:opacity protein-like surface antigen
MKTLAGACSRPVAERRRGAVWIVAVLAAAASHAALAAEEPRYQFTPFVSYATGDDFEDAAGAERKADDTSGWGIAIDIGEQPGRYYQFIYAGYDTDIKGGASKIDLDIDYLQIGGTVAWTEAKHFIPYFGLTIGAARFSPNLNGLDDATKFAFSVGAGVRVPIAQNIGLRAEWRTYVTLLGSDSELFCESDNGAAACDVHVKSNTFLQHSAQLGVTVGF